MSELATEDRRSLLALSRAKGLLWGGVFDQGGAADLIRLEVRGLIKSVSEPYSVGRVRFGGGYRITNAGRAAVGLAPSPTLREVDR